MKDHELIKLLSQMFILINRNYWQNNKEGHCGSDFDDDDCKTCKHYDYCEMATAIRDKLMGRS